MATKHIRFIIYGVIGHGWLNKYLGVHVRMEWLLLATRWNVYGLRAFNAKTLAAASSPFAPDKIEYYIHLSPPSHSLYVWLCLSPGNYVLRYLDVVRWTSRAPHYPAEHGHTHTWSRCVQIVNYNNNNHNNEIICDESTINAWCV